MTNQKEVSKALKMIPYGFYAIGSHHDGESNIMVLTWLTQASFKPQLLAIALMRDSFSYGLIEQSGVFTVNLFGQDDKEVLMPFTKARAKNPDKMKGVQFSASPELGCPVLDAAAAFIECKVVNKLESGGDHDIILAEVVNAEIRKPLDAKDMLSLPGIGWSYAG